MTGVLNGIRVVEQGTFITGPCAGMMLADLGADVVKVESRGSGDPYRNFKRRALQRPFPGLQPEQAQHRARSRHAGGSRRPAYAGARRRRLHPELPSGRGQSGSASDTRRCAPSIRASSTARSAATVRTGPMQSGRSTIRWHRRRAASSAWPSIRTIRGSLGRRWPTPSPASMPPLACRRPWSSVAAPASGG